MGAMLERGLFMDIYNFSEEYRDKLDEKVCKKEGVYYTPDFLVKYMVENLLGEFKIKKDTKILDLASGCGLFYYEILEKLKDERDIFDLISNNIFSVEKDGEAIKSFKTFLKNKYDLNENFENKILCDDALFPKNDELQNGSFDIIIGNPPYVGHKMIDSGYAKKLRETYSEVYLKKADLYYCFFKKTIEYLKEGGRASLIVPRYFLEADSASSVRDYLLENARITSLVDFRTARTFNKKINLSPCIISFVKYTEEEKIRVDKENLYKTLKPKVNIINDMEDFNLLSKGDDTRSKGAIDADEFSWSMVSFKEKEIIDAIRSKECYRLNELVENYQGIITGCDKAFIIENDSPLIEDIDDRLLKRWIKSKDIGKFFINEDIEEKSLVYTNIASEEEFRGEYKKHILGLKERLANRREVLRGIRKWYDLQWGRKEEIFEQEKIVYPFKSKGNRFSLDNKNSYFSADVYFFNLKKNSKVSYIYLLCLLNSWVYEKYMQSFLKKMGNSIYEYYPYMLLQTYIFIDENYNDIEDMGKRLLTEQNKAERENILKKIDKTILDSLKITKF